MKYFYIALAVLGIVVLLALLVCLIVHLRRRWARRKVRSTPYALKARELDEALSPFGFVYVEQEDLISSGMYPWQREMGYCRQYDEAAAAMYMVFDCEPIYFDYGGKRWLIELWKGQYGCTTGAEIGIYVNGKAGAGENPDSLFYDCAGDEERLQLQYVLYKNGKAVMTRSGLHWWLTGFRVGMYSRPEELVMDAVIRFPNIAMRNAFYEGLLYAGYRPGEIRLEQYSVGLRFDRPRTRQPVYRKCRLRFVNWRNRRNCRLYCRVTRLFVCTLDKITYIGYCFPCLYRKLAGFGSKWSRRRLIRVRRKRV